MKNGEINMKKILSIITTSLLLLSALLMAGCTVNNPSLKDTVNPTCTRETTSNTEVTSDNTVEDTLPPSTVQTEPIYTIKKLELPMEQDYQILVLDTYVLKYKKGYTTPSVNLMPVSALISYKGPLRYPKEEDIVLPDVASVPVGYSYDSTKFKKSYTTDYSNYWSSVFTSLKGEAYYIKLEQKIHSIYGFLDYSEYITPYIVQTDKFKGVILENKAGVDFQGGVATSYQLILDDGKFTFQFHGKGVSMEDLINMANSMDLHPPKGSYLEPEL